MTQKLIGQILIAPAPASSLPLGEELLESWLRETADRAKFEVWMRQFTSQPISEAIIDAYFKDVSRASELAKRGTFRMCGQDDFSNTVGATLAPTLVIAGSQDPYFPSGRMSVRVARVLPQARFHTVDGLYHVPTAAQLELIHEVARAFP